MSASQHALNVFVKMRYVMLGGIKDSSLLTLLCRHVTTASTWVKMHTTIVASGFSMDSESKNRGAQDLIEELNASGETDNFTSI